jgi:cullin 1
MIAPPSPLNDHFPDHFYEEIKQKAKEAVLQLIEKEREGELVDKTLLKNILSIFIEVSGRR